MSYEMYEDFKETMVKTIKTELATKTANNNQSMTCRNDWSKSYIQNKSGIRR
jgi:hypothetical protein